MKSGKPASFLAEWRPGVEVGADVYQLNADEQNQAGIWNQYAERGFLQSTIDPADTKGLKCDYIDRWSRHYIDRLVMAPGPRRVIEIGCGSGRNLFELATRLEHGYGVDVAKAQIANAQEGCRQRGIQNLSFFANPEELVAQASEIEGLMTMWVLAHFESDDNLVSVFQYYRRRLSSVRRYVFFEQAAEATYTVQENGAFYKKIRTVDGYREVFARLGLKLSEVRILNEKGFGPCYRFVYMSRLYQYWPRGINLNPLLFWLDRCVTRRRIARTFTDCAFVCEPV